MKEVEFGALYPFDNRREPCHAGHANTLRKAATLTEARLSWQKLKVLYAGEQPLKTEDPKLNWAGWGLR
jgi:hypothetical protein